jgi:phage gp36-like protein
MPYATQQDLVDRFTEAQLLAIADRDADSALDADVVTKALDDASEEIDSYISTRYALPLATVPGRLVAVASDIAFYKLHPAAAPEDVRQRYDDAIAFLKNVSKGVALLDVGGAEPPVAAAGVDFEGPERVFTRDSMKGF